MAYTLENIIEWQVHYKKNYKPISTFGLHIEGQCPFGHFFVMDDGSKVNTSTPQTMHCVVCYFGHNVPIQHSTHGKPRMISYNKNNGTKTLSKHVS